MSRVGAGLVECVYSARFTEVVLRRVRAERVGRERVLAGDELEVLRRHDVVQEALLRAHRAIAIDGLERAHDHAETYGAAVTAARQDRHADLPADAKSTAYDV